MQKLIAELSRLYLLPGQQYLSHGKDGAADVPGGALSPAILAQHLRGDITVAAALATDGLTRTLLIDFLGKTETQRAQRWDTLCAVANSLQADLGLPAPAVSISGAKGYGLWLSLETPLPVAQAQQFLRLLHAAYFPELEADETRLRPDSADSQVELPPCLNRSTQKWSAFIHPGMGASFAEEPGLEMSPPAAAQAGFLEGLQSIGAAQFAQALQMLRPQQAVAPAAAASPGMSPDVSPAGPREPAASALPAGLLLKDATLEQIVRLLHERNIEPTFRHLIGK